MTDTNTAQMVVDLQAADSAVQAKGWVAPGLGVPGAPLGMLSSAINPLGGLAAAGLSWFMPLVSFLGEGLTQLQGGNGASVSSGAQDFDTAGQDMAGVADSYRASATAQTSEWSGDAASQYRDSAAQHADGVAGLGEASNTVGSAIIGAGQVVAQAIAEVTELIAEAVAQIVPIMTQAVARAGETFGQSVVEAIPPCVGIAVEYALRIAAKLAALVASGDNLMKLVQGALGVVDLIKAAMTSISHQSVQADAEATAGGGSGGGGGPSQGDVASTLAEADPGQAAAGGNTGSSSPSSSGGGTGGGSSALDGLSSLGNPSAPLDPSTQSSSAVPPVTSSHGTMPVSGLSGLGSGGGGGISTGGAPGGGVAMSGVPLAPGASVGGGGRGGDTVRQENKPQAGRTTGAGGGTMGGFPMGAMGAVRPGEGDKDHERKYNYVEDHDEGLEDLPPVIEEPREDPPPVITSGQ